ncbi:hypothetical protein E2C01_085779 [Portunus trituberculatus]|uniref:Uncharacterized protein n=1 Tax=Portunus trituberculatus TaxID=210409 RepID=A0A5B7J7M1_PORTR|nr:hypothetical protein [Portunus trituberculatus]
MLTLRAALPVAHPPQETQIPYRMTLLRSQVLRGGLNRCYAGDRSLLTLCLACSLPEEVQMPPCVGWSEKSLKERARV